MPGQHDSLSERLSRSREIHLSVSGRKSGRTITIPVWFASDGEKLYLLPVQGSDTQWYKNVQKNPTIQVQAGSTKAELKAVPITKAAEVLPVTEKFRAKYGAGDVKKYYSKLDVAVEAKLQKAR
jgi:deazaflavin-dependent oxidoreductase (nitroreductase family)